VLIKIVTFVEKVCSVQLAASCEVETRWYAFIYEIRSLPHVANRDYLGMEAIFSSQNLTLPPKLRQISNSEDRNISVVLEFRTTYSL